MRSLLAALLLSSAVSNAFEVKRDSSGEIAAWKSGIHFILDENFSRKLDAARAADGVSAAIATVQTAVPALSIDVTPGKPHGIGYDFDQPAQSTSDIVVPDDWKFDENAVAVTVVSLSKKTHAIIEADIAFNARHTAFTVVGVGPEVTRYDVQNAMTHELGHALGLAHNDLPQSVMYPHSTPGEVSKRVLSKDDLDGLEFLYPSAIVSMTAPRAVGCNATGSAPFALLAVGLVLLSRRRAAATLLMLGALTFVAPVFAAAVTTEQAWKVESTRTVPPASGSAVLQTELTLERDGVRHVVHVWGGSFGDIEQIVEGLPVPEVGTRLVLASDPSSKARR